MEIGDFIVCFVCILRKSEVWTTPDVVKIVTVALRGFSRILIL